MESARESVRLIGKDETTFAIVGGLGEIFMTIGRLFIGFGVSLVVYVVIINLDWEMLVMPYLVGLICFVILIFSTKNNNKGAMFHNLKCVYGSLWHVC